MPLPVLDVLPALRRALQNAPLTLLQAPPGAGKSTALPLELLQEPWLGRQKIIMLQPRRVAARAVAARMAELLGEAVGETVGYRVRFESRASPGTRIEVVTEGILTRLLQRDPALEGVGLVIFDEFHERSLHADLALALAREAQGALREDLRLLVMSATLGDDLPSKLDSAAPVIEAAGRPYPVELRYLPTDPTGELPETVARGVSAALEAQGGDVLAFLPGVAEIARTRDLLSARHPELRILALYGDLPLSGQRRALLPDPRGARRVVLATSIAETSLTIEGVRAVVDSGFSRLARFDSGSGLTRLVTARVTRDAAEQRAGRAGRLGPGLCLRLWSERTHAALAARRAPEILEADLAPTVLELARWGVTDLNALAWPDAPPERGVGAARELLTRLGALDGGRLTPRGARMLDLPTHPRLAHLLLEGVELGLGGLACDVAALLEERDPLGREAGADLGARVRALRAFREGHVREGHVRRGEGQGDRDVLARAERLSRQWRRVLNEASQRSFSGEDVGALVALAYPERVAQLRAGERLRYRLAGGRGARLPEDDALAGTRFLAVAHLDAGAQEGRIHLAAELDPAVLEPQARERDVVSWDARSGSLTARREKRVGELILEEKALPGVPLAARAAALCGAVREEGLELLPWTREARQLQARVLSLSAWNPGKDWPNLSDAALLASLEDWLGPHLNGIRKREDFARLDLAGLLRGLLPWPQMARLDDLAPQKLTVPSGHDIRLEYFPDGAPPVLAVRVQELFGLARTPSVNEGRTEVLLHLLSPAGRPVQVTRDLASFWARGYPEVKKELKGRYPKHPWPDDPWSALPTRGVKARS